jgi:hypothetical protein
MIPDPKWLDALRLPLRVTIAVALASAVLLALELGALLDLGPLGAVTRPALIIVVVVFCVLAIVGGIDYLLAPLHERRRQSALASRREVRRKEEEEMRAARRQRVIAQLDNLSMEEIRCVATSLKRGSPSFYTFIASPPVSMLLGKGLVWTPGGQHHEDTYPFSFHDFVWEKILEREQEFLAKDEENKRGEKAREDRRRGI